MYSQKHPSGNNTSSISLQNNKTSFKINKNHNSPLSVNTLIKNNERVGFHKKCYVQTPSSDKQRPVSGKFKRSPSKVPSPQSRTFSPQHTPGGQKLDHRSFNPSSSPEVTQSSEEIAIITAKFEELSTSILQLATSSNSLGSRSLEALITQEVTKSVGNAISNPKFSQGFIQATRNLLNSLVTVYEEGKIHPHLIRNERTANQLYLKSESSTTVCYRGRYFKEVLMSVLHGMCSNEVDEDTNQKITGHVQSAASKERIRAIRDMVRTEAGLEPETMVQLEKQLAELKKGLSQNQVELQRATTEVEKMISTHLLSYDRCGSGSSLDIPKRSSGALRGPVRNGNGKDIEDWGLRYNPVCDSQEKTNNGYASIDSKINPLRSTTNTEYVDSIRPNIENIVRKELQRVKEQSRRILNKNGNSEKGIGLNDSDSELDVESLHESDYEEDDETDEEDTRIFLEALKADIEQRKHLNESVSADVRLEVIDEDEENMHSDSANNTGVTSNIGTNIACCTIRPNIGEGNIANGLVLEGETTSSITIHNTENERGFSNCQLNANEIGAESEYQLQFKSSRLWMKDKVIDIIKNTRLAFSNFNVEGHNVVNDINIRESDITENDHMVHQEVSNYERSENKVQYTVEEVADILENISLKMYHLPTYLEEAKFNLLQEKELCNIIKMLENTLSYSGQTCSEVILSLQDEKFPLLVKKVSKTFSFISEMLNRAPPELKRRPISSLAPPEPLSNTLELLESSEYFKQCFLDINSQEKYNPVDDGSLSSINYCHTGSHHLRPSKEIKVVKPYDIAKKRSSGEINSGLQKHGLEIDLSSKNKTDFTSHLRKSGDIDKYLSDFEHFIGLTSSVMTVQNVSDMFLFLSTVLNDVPDRIKSKNILSLNPPNTLLRALEILYSDDDGSSVDVKRKTSFASLTLQNASDFFLTLSKTFQDAPLRVKSSIVLDLNPPRSLLRAITLLTSLSACSVLESRSQEEVEEEIPSVVRTETDGCGVDSQDEFYDAVDSFPF